MSKILGVLGGMGPQASATFYDLLIREAIKKDQPQANHTYPHIVLVNIPVPDLIDSTEKMQETIRMVHNEAKKLEAYGVELLVMPCNTMHLYQTDIMEGRTIPFLSMVDAVVEKAKQYKKVGIIGSKTLLQAGLYQEKLGIQGIVSVLPHQDEQETLVEVIQSIIAGDYTKERAKRLEAIVERLQKEEQVEAVILGCTELPLVLGEEHRGLPLLRSLHILAEAVGRANS